MGFFGSIVKHFVSFGLRLFSLVSLSILKLMFGSNGLWFFQGLPSTSLRCWVTKTLTSSSSTGWSITWEAATRWEGDTHTTSAHHCRPYDCECGVVWALFQYWTELLMVLLAVWLSAWLVPLCVPGCDVTLPHVFQIESGTVWKQVYMDLGIPVLNSAASYNVKTAYKK